MDCSLRVQQKEEKEMERTQSPPSPEELGDWQNKTRTVLSRTSFLLDLPELRDIKFVFPAKEGDGECQEKIIWGHKLILAMASPVFYKMFYHKEDAQFVTVVEDEVKMENHVFSAEAFQAFITFLYTDKINYEESSELLTEILKCADYYGVTYLKKECGQQLEKHFSATNVISILETAFLHSEKELQNKCITFIDQNLRIVFESQEILFCKVETLFEILKRDSLDMDECHLLDLALKWAENECERQDLDPTPENKRKVLGATFFQIRFALLTSARISEIVDTNLLSPKEAVDILLEIHTPGNIRDPTFDWANSKRVLKLAPAVSFKSNLRRYGMNQQAMMDSRLIYKLRQESHAHLHISGFSRLTSEYEIEDCLESRGLEKDLQVTKLRPGEFYVQFTYCPATITPEEFVDPKYYGFRNPAEIKIEECMNIAEDSDSSEINIEEYINIADDSDSSD